MKGKSKRSTIKHCKMATLKEIDRAEPRDGVFTARAEILVLFVCLQTFLDIFAKFKFAA